MDALPLPLRPDLEQYRKRAKELVVAARSRDTSAVHTWARQWIEALARHRDLPGTPQVQGSMDRAVAAIEEAIRQQAAAPEGATRFALADAQFLLARAHGFRSWTAFVGHLRGVARSRSPVANFEAAADAVIAGDLVTLRELLAREPGLVRARSTRSHGATLLHYVAANGVEDYRQKSPHNAVAVAELLLDSGADVHAECDAYGGGSTVLALAASSVHPEGAGVQQALLELLLQRGADLEHRSPGGHTALTAALFNGRGAAAALLAARGARLDLVSASAVGRLDAVRGLLAQPGTLAEDRRHEVETALVYACLYGRTEVAAFLLAQGVEVAAQEGHGQSGLHYAVIGGHLDVVRLLLAHHAPVELRNVWGGTALGQATWCIRNEGRGPTTLEVIRALLDAGARVEEADFPTGEADVDALLRSRGAGHSP